MPSLTAVELGADTCVLARTVVRHGEIAVSAVEMLDPSRFSGIDSFTLAVRQSRRSLRLPRRCRAVVWGLPDGAGRNDPAVLPLIEPLLGAGFRIERVVSPQNALAALARLRTPRGDGAMCWLTINRGGVAIVVVRPGKQMYAHSFLWDSTVGATGSQARLLQRYSLVSFLAPEVKRAMAIARDKGNPVVGIVTCGNLPDLRSLTMPLIEELDVEVETLDSLEGLKVKPAAVDRLAESASAMRIACAGAIARSSRRNVKRRVRRGLPFWLQGAALVAAAAGLGWLWYWRLHGPVTPPVTVVRQPAAVTGSATRPSLPPPLSVPAKPPAVVAAAPIVTTAPKRPEPTSPAASLPAKRPEPKPPGVSVPTKPPAVVAPAPALTTAAKHPEPTSPAASLPAKRPEPNPPGVSGPAKPPAVVAPAPVVTTAPKRPEPTSPLANLPAKRPEPKPPGVSVPERHPDSNPHVVSVPATRPDPKPPAVSVPTKPVAVVAAAPVVATAAKRPESTPPGVSIPAKHPESNFGVAARTLPEAAVGADKSQAKLTRPRPMPARLTDPVPRVTGLLVSAERRLATIDERQIVSIGDLVGRRVVVAIDERTVVFQEPSGVQIRVALGGRVVGVQQVEK